MADQLSAEHFSLDAHRDIYKIIVKLVAEGREPSPLTVTSQIGNTDLRAYLGTLVVRSSEAVQDGIQHSVQALADEIVSLAQRRKLQAAAEQAAALANTPPEAISTDDLYRKLEDLVGSLPQRRDARAIETAGDLTLAAFEKAQKIYETGEAPGFRSGFKPFDDLVGPLIGGDMIIIGGATSQGKSALCQQIAFEVAKEKNVLCVSLEMTRDQWNNRYLTQITGISSEVLEVGPFDEKHFEMIDRAWRDVMRHIKMVVCDQRGMTLPQIAAYARRVKRRFGLDMLVIDHLGFVKHEDPHREGPSMIADITSGIKSLALSLDVPVIVASHLNRDTAKRDNYRPTLADLYGSSAIEKDADVVLFVHRLAYWIERRGPEKNQSRAEWEYELSLIRDEAELILGKRRRGRGAGSILCTWDADKTMFIER